MKIYFAGSITGGRNDSGLYFEIIDLLKTYGEVLTEHIGNKNLSNMGENKTPKDIYERDIDWVKKCDVFIAEVTNPSFGVGIEIARASEFGKKIFCFYRPSEGKQLSRMVLGCPGVKVFEYENIDQLKNIFDLNLK